MTQRNLLERLTDLHTELLAARSVDTILADNPRRHTVQVALDAPSRVMSGSVVRAPPTPS
jgi:hypothetical protein